MWLSVVLAYLLFPLALAAPEGDLIKIFPGWAGAQPSKAYSGFIDSDETGWMHTHYVFVESEGNPAKDPVLLWFNGGPGASSLFGFFVELGPYILSDASLQTREFNETGIPTVFYNPYSWSKLGNLLIVNSPPPVGFSYCDTYGPSGNGTSCGDWDDDRTARTNHIFLKNWLKAFPEYQSNPVFITGESYAGVYVPTLAREILNDPNNTINLKGFAVGDACMGTDVLCGDHKGPYWNLVFMYGHGQVSTKLYQQIIDTCTVDVLISGSNITDDCQELLAQFQTEVGGYYEYNLYDECWGENGIGQPQYALYSHPSNPLPARHHWGPPSISKLMYPNKLRQQQQQQGQEQGQEQEQQGRGGEGEEEMEKKTGSGLEDVRRRVGQLNDYPCGGGGAMAVYLNNTAVRRAFHIPKDAYFFDQDDGNDFNYTLTEKNLLPFYVEVARNYSNIRALVYNGDTDPGINSFISQNWTTHLGLAETEQWRPWTLDGKEKMAGYVTSYEGDFHFLTIRGSGHMVPEFKPPAAYEMLSRWLHHEDWLPYPPDMHNAHPKRTRAPRPSMP